MNFCSPQFLLLIAVLTAVYYLAGSAQKYVLLLASCVFYAFCGKTAALYLVVSIIINYTAGRLIEKAEGRNRTLLLSAALILDFGALAFVKYAPLKNLIAPLGVSFYTFQSAGYLIDVKRKKLPAEKSFFDFALFVSFFPQLVQGPVGRYGTLAPQLKASRKFDPRSFKFGVQLMMAGYMKKLIIADRAAVITGNIFKNYLTGSGGAAIIGVLMYSVQIYCDFSGGIDIASGAAEIFGIKLDENFRRPLFAQSLADYWRRWHITLGSWMKDYVFYPLVLSRPFIALGNRSRAAFRNKFGKMVPTIAATFIVYFIIGIWHGSGSKYMVFGLYNGLILSISQLLAGTYSKVNKKLNIDHKKTYIKILCMFRTLLLVLIGRFFSRGESTAAALVMIKRIFVDLRFSESVKAWSSYGASGFDWIVIGIGTLILIAIEIYQENHGSFREYLEQQSMFVQWLYIIIPLGALLILMPGSGYVAAEFIYKQY